MTSRDHVVALALFVPNAGPTKAAIPCLMYTTRPGVFAYRTKGALVRHLIRLIGNGIRNSISTRGSERASNQVRRLANAWRFPSQQTQTVGESLVVPVEELMRDFPLVVTLE
jgi:hypothetical protein